MLTTSRLLVELTKQYIAVAEASGEYRLILPGLTPRIGEEVHEGLLSESINSFLVIGQARSPNQDLRWLLPVSLTTMRIGSFVAVTDPGALADIQDSIRGSGGTIRSYAFSEEWPWLDGGNEAFRFSNRFEVLLVESWTDDLVIRNWLESWIRDVLIDATRRSPRRTELLLEDIVGKFSTAGTDVLPSIQEIFLFHCGIPLPDDINDQPPKIAQKVRSLVTQILDRISSEPNVRQQVLGNIGQQDPHVAELTRAVNDFFDGLADPSSLDGNVLAFKYCWGTGESKVGNWRLLTCAKLRELFEVQEQEPVELCCRVVPREGILISENGRSVAGPASGNELIDVHYAIPPSEFAEANCQLQLAIRNRTITERTLSSASGDIQFPLCINDTGLSYRNRVPVRISVLVNGEARDDFRLHFHCYGTQRPAFVVTTPSFWADDATETSAEDPSPERRYQVEGPIAINLFADEDEELRVTRDDDTCEQLVTRNGIWSTAEALDAFSEPSGQVVCTCFLGTRWVSLAFEAADIQRGEFTLEDELRESIAVGNADRVREVLSIYSGLSNDPYSRLGGLTSESRRRSLIARFFEDRLGWKPILADLLSRIDALYELCGDYAITMTRDADVSAIETVTLADVGLEILRSYTDTRDQFRQSVLATLSPGGAIREHPDYAVYPTYVLEENGHRQRLEQALCEYLSSFIEVQEYLYEHHRAMDWAEAFIYTYLDCIVHWRDDQTKNCIFLLGPWHPLVVSKRFMVQHALASRGRRLIDSDDKDFSQLTGLLAQVPGFHWQACLRADDTSFEPAYVTPTTDPGWHLAFKRRAAESGEDDPQEGLLARSFASLRRSLGLEPLIHLPASGGMVHSILGSYARTFPSKRHLGVYFPPGFRGEEEIAAVDAFLHVEDGTTREGDQLTGGINLSFGDKPSVPEDTSWSHPELKVYQHPSRDAFIDEQYPDIQFCRADDRLEFLEIVEPLSIPRGSGYEVVFSHALSRIVQGQTFIPQSQSEEWEVSGSRGSSLSELFLEACARACNLAGNASGILRKTDLPPSLKTAWTVVPGAVLDPAVFVRYVMDGRARAVEERALWDYRVDLSRASSSFFILSTVPTAFRIAVNGVFNQSQNLASEFVTELGQVGLAIAGEAMKSGRHALGTIGVVGAVRLFSGDGVCQGPLHWTGSRLGFLLPVDSFRELLENRRQQRGETSELGGRRADLLAIVLGLPANTEEQLIIQPVAIESKFTSGTYPVAFVQDALAQAEATTARFRRICEVASTDAGLPERMALLQLVCFGLRITGHSTGEASQRLDKEKQVYEKILRGEFEYRPARSASVLISTEVSLPGPAEVNQFDAGDWYRLNLSNWPGVSESDSINTVRQVIESLFDIPSELPPHEPTGTTGTESEGAYEPQVEEVEGPCDLEEVAEEVTPPIPIGGREAPLIEDYSIQVEPIMVGTETSRRPVYFDPHSPVDRLDNANVMTTGSSGKGKTQLLKYLITSLIDQGANILVLDFKNDFASDSTFIERANLEATLVAFDGMPFNPLIPYPVTDPRTGSRHLQCGQHVAGIASVFRSTYILGAQQEAAVKNAIRQAFIEVGVDPAGTIIYDAEMTYPDLARVGEILEQTNTTAYNRLDPLFTLNLFREQQKRASFASIFSRCIVIDFSQIPSDPLRNALAQLVVLSAHSFFNSQQHCGGLRQVFVVDEAHRVLKADFLERFALECRAYGVSLMLSSQYPSHFPPGISASMATKIIHGNDRDVDRVREIINLLGCTGREAEVAELGMFEAMFSNKHHTNTLIRTMTFTLSLVTEALKRVPGMTYEELASIDGVDTQKLSIGNIVRHLERLGLCETVDGSVRFVGREG